ncbi:MAG: general secretion pathway protein GspL [Burkholderiales bacterium 68-12]|nr:MAG: general secretion pathway protein GspL [Burkholderiales bacterium 68-12]
MSTLIVHLPLARASAATEYRYTLSQDGQQVARHGVAAASMLPPAGRTGETVALVPVQALSWQRVTLPPGVGPQSPRLRSVLEGLLEDRVLDEPATLHFALEPQARAGQQAWVAVCDRAWLQAALQALEAAGRPVARVLPELAPGALPALHVLGSTAEDALLACAPGPGQGLRLLPLAAASLALAGLDGESPPPAHAEPAVAALAEQALGRSVQLQTEHERALQAAQGAWDLAQADLARSARARTLRKASSLAGSLLRAPQWRAVRWGAALCVLAHLAGLNAWAWQERQALAAKQAGVRQVLTGSFPQIQVVVDAPVQMERELARLRQAAGSLSERDFEALLAAAAQALPPGPPPTAIDFGPGELRLRGIALPPEALEAAQARLRGTDHTLHGEADGLVVRTASSP